MNNVFNFSRFGKCLTYDFRRIRSQYGLSFLIMALMPVVLYVITIIFGLLNMKGWSTPAANTRLVEFFIVTGALLLSFPPSAYGFITEKKAGSSWLMIPASGFEKFLSLVLVSIVLMPLAYAVLYFGSDWILSVADKAYGVSLFTKLFGEDMKIINVSTSGIQGTGVGLYSLYVGFVTTVMTFILGSVIFRKSKVVKTILCIIALSLVFTLIVSFIATHTDPEWWRARFESLFGSETISPDTVIRRVKIFANVVSWGFICLLGLGTFLRIKKIKH